MPQTITRSKGDSCTIKVIVPTEIVADINEIVVSLGNNLSARLSDNTLTQVSNVFTWRIKSNLTKNLGQNLSVITSIDRDGYGNRKSKVETAPKISFLDNSNPESNISTSDFVDLTVSYTFTEEELEVSETIFNAFYNNNFQKIIQVFGISDGDNLKHNLNADCYGQFVQDGQVQSGFWIEQVDSNNSTFKAPILENLVTDFTGYVVINKLVNYSNRIKYFDLPNDIASLQDGSTITHGMNGDVLIEFIQDGQIQGGFYGVYLTLNTSTFRTPFFEDILNQTFITGTIKCTKLN